MWVWSARAATFALAVIGWAGAAAAGDLADFNAAVEVAAAHNRVTLGYLRTGNTDLAAVELERLRAAWAQVNQRFAGKRPLTPAAIVPIAPTSPSPSMISGSLIANMCGR